MVTLKSKLKLSKNEWLKIVELSESFSDVAKQLGISRGGDTIKAIKKILQNLEIDYTRIDLRKGKSNLGKKFPQKSELSLQRWKRGEILGFTGKTLKVKPFIRNYLFTKYDSKCKSCGWNKKHPVTGNIPLEVNHIDGDASNCIEENIELLCPNCHSLTVNFRNLNKESRRER